MSIEALREAWKGFSVEGASVALGFGPVWTGNEHVDAYTVGLTFAHEGRRYGTFACLSEPVFIEYVADVLKQRFLKSRAFLESQSHTTSIQEP